MERSEIDKAAFKGEEIESTNLADEVYWLGMYYIYRICRADNISKDNARKIKAEFSKRVDNIADYERIFHNSLWAMVELDKLIAPESELLNKSKAELIEKIIRFQTLLNGTLMKCDGEIPQMYDNLMKAAKESENT